MLRYAITDRKLLGSTEAEQANAVVVQAAGLAARGDIDYLQLREKDLSPGALAALARRVLDALRSQAPDSAGQIKLLINSRADVAITVRAAGVHLTSSPGELTPAQVRRLYAEAGLPVPIVSLSCHSLGEVEAAQTFGPDLILFGPVFEKRVGDRLVAEGLGLDLLRQACAAASTIPVLALGGITEENTADCIAAGAAGIAGIRLFL